MRGSERQSLEVVNINHER